MAKQAIEQTGIIPRSIIRTFDRFRKQLLSGSEKLVIQEFRISRFQVLVSVKCLLTLTIIPLVINYFLKNFVLIPVTENLWNRQQNEIFLNSYQQDRAFEEIQKFEEKLYFDFLINDVDHNFVALPSKNESNQAVSFATTVPFYSRENFFTSRVSTKDSFNKTSQERTSANLVHQQDANDYRVNIPEVTEKKLIQSNKFLQEEIQEKTIELAIHYNQQSIIALTNLFGDLITFGVVSFLVIWMKPQIIILKSFLTESIYSLSDTTKSFLLILGTDLLVGFHSPRGWEIGLELVLKHFGFPENQDFIYLFVATFPVLLDTVFKYWIFRYLNQISPSTVATYHSMIE